MSKYKMILVLSSLSLLGAVNNLLAGSLETICPSTVSLVNGKVPDSINIGSGLNLPILSQPTSVPVNNYSFISVELSQGTPPYFNALSCWYQAPNDDQNVIGYGIEEQGVDSFSVEGNNWQFIAKAATCSENTTVCPFDITTTRYFH